MTFSSRRSESDKPPWRNENSYHHIMPITQPAVDDFEIPNVSQYGNRHIQQEDVRHWKRHAAINYRSMDDIQKSQVIILYWCKNDDGLEHEYLVAKCRRPGGVKFYLRVEREPTDYSVVVPVEAASPHTRPDLQVRHLVSREHFHAFKGDVEAEGWRQLRKQSSWTTARISAQKAKMKKLSAMDSVTHVDNPEGSLGNGEKARLVARYLAFQEPFCVRDLAFLACSVTARQPLYELLTHQCYWYARAILNVAVAIYRPTVVPGASFGKAGTYSVKGAFLAPTLTLSEDCEEETNIIKEEFAASLESHTSEVQQRFQERLGKLQEAEEKFQEEKRKRQKIERQLADRRLQESELSANPFSALGNRSKAQGICEPPRRRTA